MRKLTVLVCLFLGFQLSGAPAKSLPKKTTASSSTSNKHLSVPEGYAGKAGMYPDPDITPGDTNPDVTQDSIQRNVCKIGWSTSSVRNTATTEEDKAKTYDNYGIPHPKNNEGPNQVCELDHLISIENGGSDSIKNIWPQCGPGGVLLPKRYFKMKDRVENYIHNGICRDIKNAKLSSGPTPPKTLSLKEGQDILRGDWYACYQKFLQHKACN